MKIIRKDRVFKDVEMDRLAKEKNYGRQEKKEKRNKETKG